MPFENTPTGQRFTGPSGVWKSAGDDLALYDQLLLTPDGNHACTYVAVMTAASNLCGVKLTNRQLQEGWDLARVPGGWKPGTGCPFGQMFPVALDVFNKLAGKSLSGAFVPLNPDSVTEALAAGKGGVFGLRAGPKYLADEQDNGVIDSPAESAADAKYGHAVALVKVNTTDPYRWTAKYLESYNGRVWNGKPVKEVIQFFADAFVTFQRTLYVISK